MLQNVVPTHRAMMQELFGIATTKRASIRASDVHLPSKPVRDVDPKKMESISKKYCKIPQRYIGYYPAPNTVDDSNAEPEGTAAHDPKVRKALQ